MIETLETRRLFSTVATDEAALTADALAVKADFTAVVATAKIELAAVKTDLKALPRTKADKALVRSVLKDEATATRVLTNGIKKIVATEAGKLKQLFADGVAVALHPSGKGAQERLKALLGSVETSVQTPLTNLEVSAYPAIVKVATDFSAIEIENPTDTLLPADISTYGAPVTAALSKLSTDGTTVQADLATLVTDLN